MHLISQAGLEALLLQAVTGLSPGAAAAAVTSCWHPCSPTRTMLAVSATPAAEEHFKGTMASVSHSGSFFDAPQARAGRHSNPESTLWNILRAASPRPRQAASSSIVRRRLKQVTSRTKRHRHAPSSEIFAGQPGCSKVPRTALLTGVRVAEGRHWLLQVPFAQQRLWRCLLSLETRHVATEGIPPSGHRSVLVLSPAACSMS